MQDHPCDDPSHCHYGPCRMSGGCQQPWLRKREEMKQETLNHILLCAVVMLFVCIFLLGGGMDKMNDRLTHIEQMELRK
jgi:hypothetical protein